MREYFFYKRLFLSLLLLTGLLTAWPVAALPEKATGELIFNRQLKQGMSGTDVSELQDFFSQFRDVYPEALVTGYYGARTVRAVRRFQKKVGLPITGRVDEKTRRALNELINTEGDTTATNEFPAVLSSKKVPSPTPASTPTQPTSAPTRVDTIPVSTPILIPSSTIPTTAPVAGPLTPSSPPSVNPVVPILAPSNNPVITPTPSSNQTPAPSPANASASPPVTPSATTAPTASTTGSAASSTPTADTTAPVISLITSSNITTNSVTISWTTNELATAQVAYGATVSYGSVTDLNNTLITYHSVIVSGLDSGITYHFVVKSRDASGNLTTSADQTVSTVKQISGACRLGGASSNYKDYYLDKPGLNSLTELKNSCTSADFKSLLSKACSENSSYMGGEGVVTRAADGSTNSGTVGSFGAGTRKCVQLPTYETTLNAGACYLAAPNFSASYMVYQDPDLGSGYAKTNLDGSNDYATIKPLCTAAVYTSLLTKYCAANPGASNLQESVVSFDVRGSGVTFGLPGPNLVLISCPSARHKSRYPTLTLMLKNSPTLLSKLRYIIDNFPIITLALP